MNIVEMQPSILPPSFPVADTRPSHAQAYLDRARHAPPYPENLKSPTRACPSDKSEQSPRSTATPDVRNNGVHVQGQQSPTNNATATKKRSADGELKKATTPPLNTPTTFKHDHSRNTSTVSNASTVSELSQQLRTKLTYAMIKVQNGWQNRSLDEVESLASASPHSTTFNHYSNSSLMLSPRAAIAAQLNRQNSGGSDGSERRTYHTTSAPTAMSPPLGRKGLAPPANIVSRPNQQRRRPTPNVQVSTGMEQPSPARPAVKHRTPSQTAAIEADAVETLLFMASPNNSGHHSSQFSPVTSAPSMHQFPSQTSPLRQTFSAPTSPKRVNFAPETGHFGRTGYDKNAVIASMIEKLDEDGDADLDEALKLMDRHHATKVMT